MAIRLAQMKRASGNRRRVVRFRPIKVPPKSKRELERIILEMVEFVYSFAEELIATVPTPGVTTDAAHDNIDRLISIIITQTNSVMARLQLRVKAWARAGEDLHRIKWKEGVLAASGVDIGTQLHADPVRGTVGAVVTRNVSLIRDVGEEARKRIVDITVAGVQQRKPPVEVAREIREVEPMSRRRAINIAADQATKLSAALDRARQQEAGVDHFTWRHSGKVHAREEHLARDGEVFEWEGGEIDPGDFPGEPPFCGCVAQATLIDSDGNESPDESDLDELDLEDVQ